MRIALRAVSRRWRRLLLGLCLAFGGAILPARSDAPEKRFALLVQNDAYPDAEPLAVADGDAAALATSLRANGFEVDFETNANRLDLRSHIRAFVARVTPNATALVYFKGIGIEASRSTYLIPVDASIWSDDDIRRHGTSLDAILSDLDARGAGVKIAIVDAARPNPFERRFRMSSAGLAASRLLKSTLVMFANALDAVAAAPKDPVGPFMSELLAQMKRPIRAAEVFAQTRDAVAKVSRTHDRPFVASSLDSAFSFIPGATPRPPVPMPNVPPKPAPGSDGLQAPQSALMPPTGRPTQVASLPPNPPPPVGSSKPKPDETPSPPMSLQVSPISKPLAMEPRPGRTFRDCPHCPEMMVLAPSKFEMGSGATPFDRPVHSVTLSKPFAVARSLVTRDEWKICVDQGFCGWHIDRAGSAEGSRPVAGVNWFDAEQYVGFLAKTSGKAYRLPTEAEWEYAARGGTTTTFAWGDTTGVGHANCIDCGNKSGQREVEPIMTYPQNGFGLFDMAGNVAE